MNAIYLPMVFISGVFFSVGALPGFLEAIADVLPLTYLLDLIRAVFVDGDGLDSLLAGDPAWSRSGASPARYRAAELPLGAP